MKYLTILADPPWEQEMSGRYKQSRKSRAADLPYNTMTTLEIRRLRVKPLAADGCHLWLWTTNQFLEAGFEVIRAWGFTYLAPIHWIKPSGLGNYFIHRTQTLLFGYRGKLRFGGARYVPNVFDAPARRHSEKPHASYSYIEAISPEPRLELFSRAKRIGWDSWGNEAVCDVDL